MGQLESLERLARRIEPDGWPPLLHIDDPEGLEAQPTGVGVLVRSRDVGRFIGLARLGIRIREKERPPTQSMTTDETLPANGIGTPNSEPQPVDLIPRIGELVLRRYHIKKELGRGGQAVVFEALDLELERRVALKVLAPTLAESGDGDWQGLLDEAKLQAAVEAPGIARLLDASREGERRYLVMELVRGPGLKEVIADLRDRRQSEGTRPASGAYLIEAAGLARNSSESSARSRWSWDRSVAEFGALLARSVASLHECGLIHRDLKPGNIKFDSAGRPVVLDFGLARWMSAPKSERLQGTPGYMAPEQLEAGGGRLDERTDIYQLGLILYEMAGLERAYPADVSRDLSRYITLAREGRVRPLGDVDPRADVGLQAVITKSLDPIPENRYASLDDLANDLERIVKRRPPELAPTPLSYRMKRHFRRAAFGPIGAALLAAAVLAPAAWAIRAALVEEVTSVEGWSFSPKDAKQLNVVDDSVIRVGDDLGIRVSASSSRVLYVLSIFGEEHRDEQFVSPMRPTRFENGVLQAHSGTQWGVSIGPGTHELLCTRILEDNAREGLIVFASEKRSAIFEGWLAKLDEAMQGLPFGIDQEVAFAMLDDIRQGGDTRGGAILTAEGQAQMEELARERERYAGLSAAKAAGQEDWDLGEGLVRFQVMCRVLAE